MRGALERAFGYQGDSMNLPVAGFSVVSRNEMPHKSAVLARDGVQIGLAENGGDASQDGCAFHVGNLDALFEEFSTKGERQK